MRVSLVTPVLNRARFMPDMLASVARQGDVSVEHIVVDGGSTDGTLDILARLSTAIVLTGPDAGLYDAINKGIARATGEIVGLLNSDDVLPDGALSAVVNGFVRSPGAEAICGSAEFEWRHTGQPASVTRIDDSDLKRLDLGRIAREPVLTNARFFRRAAMLAVGPFDQRFRIVADRDFVARYLLAGKSFVPIEATVYRYRCHEGSLTMGTAESRLKYLADDLLAARTRLAEVPPGSAARAFYRDWQAWAALRVVLARTGAGRFGPAVRSIAETLGSDRWAVPRALAQVPNHLRGRSARRGVGVGTGR